MGLPAVLGVLGVGMHRVLLPMIVLVSLVLTSRASSQTVEEQRARLPPPAFCDDPVAGRWVSLSYVEYWGDWYEFTLDVHRVEDSDTQLRGTILSHSWDGVPTQPEPGPCQGQLHYRVSMNALGSITDDQIHFGGVDWQLDEVLCGRAGYGWNYNPDQFTGTIDRDLQEFQSVNNDGGILVNQPTVFRRVDCFEEGDEPPARIEITPPALRPPDQRSGCGRGR